jgi:RNA polymerase sigma-70 factor (ECF subfamily)
MRVLGDVRRASRADAAVAEAVARGRAAWNGIDVPRHEFAGFLTHRLPENAVPAQALRALPVADLYLACACARGDAAALDAFERAVMPAVDVAIGSLRPSADFRAELRQRVREHLLVARPPDPPRIVEYRGRGPLGAWVRVVALRIGLELRRNEAQAVRRADELAREVPLVGFDQELDYVRSRYHAPIKRAFQEALGDLPDRERNMLQLHLLDDVSLSQIGALYGVDKSTASRWLSRARGQILEGVRRRLRASLGLGAAELDSMIQLFASRLDLSLDRILPGG